MTDIDGNYSVAAIVPQNASAGDHDVYASFSPGAGKALMESSTAPVVVSFGDGGQKREESGIPFEWSVVLGVFVLLIVAVAATLLYRRYAVRKPEKAIGPVEAPVFTPAEAVIAPEKSAFSVEEEIALIRSSIVGPNMRAATTQAYLASRKLLASTGLKLEGSMTHHEVYRAAAARFPEASRPFKYIVDLYEKAVFAGRQPADREIEEAIDGLKEAAARLSLPEGGR
jgi:hypothetical protein